jgi:hypothetical protein
MVNKFREQERRPTFINIGISKYSCWLCEKYLELLVQNESGFTPDMKVAVSGYQGKIQSGWTVPPNGPPDCRIVDGYHPGKCRARLVSRRARV